MARVRDLPRDSNPCHTTHERAVWDAGWVDADREIETQYVDAPILPCSTDEGANVINGFVDDHCFLLTTYVHPVTYEGDVYGSAEYAFQASKVHPSERHLVRNSPTWKMARRMANSLPMVPGWESDKLAILYEVLKVKFQDENLRARLLATGDDVLIDSNPWYDLFFGVVNGIGENWLGWLLMRLRAEIRISADGKVST